MNTDILKPFFQYLVQNNLVDVTSIATEVSGAWKLTQDFAGLTTGTAFSSRQDMLDRISQAVITQYSGQASHLRAAV